MSPTELRFRVDRLADAYIAELQGVYRAAGWHQPSSLAALIDFCGDLPPPSGKADHDARMIREIDYLIPQSKHRGDAIFLFGRPFGHGVLSVELGLILLSSRYYARLPEEQISEICFLTIDQYRGRLRRGRELAGAEIEKGEKYLRCRKIV